MWPLLAIPGHSWPLLVTQFKGVRQGESEGNRVHEGDREEDGVPLRVKST